MTLVFGIVFLSADISVYLAFVFGGIALATAPALSIVNEFHAKRPVTDTLLPIAIGLVAGFPAGWILKKVRGRVQTLAALLAGITLTVCIGWIMNVKILPGINLNYHLILGAGLYTFIYIAARGTGKYFGARFGAKAMKMPDTVQKYLGFTLLPHSGVSLVFTGIACSSLAANPELVGIVQGTIAAAAVINEIIAVIAAKKAFELAGEI